jgi:prepilin-type N-terminal cleavage/methylation domain-containing protein
MTKRQQQQNLSQSQDGGYTIIESLVAMIVVSVLMIAIAPVMAFSVATRVQARRVELATQAARAYIDALRAGAIAGPIPAPAGQGFPIQFTGANVADATAPTDRNALYCLDMDGDGVCNPSSSKDFYVQGAWRNPLNPPDPTTTGYELMVRVYRADSFDGTVNLKTTPKNEKKQSVVGSGLGDRTMPVVEMTTQIPPTREGGASAYRSLCARTNGC